MYKIRVFEEHANELYLTGKMPGLAHMYAGQEGVAVGVCEALDQTDYITSTHRGHGHCLAKGAELKYMFCELLGKAEGYCGGKGGSMHIADQINGNLGANAIVGGSAGIATGAAMSAKRLGTKRVAVCFFGDGAHDRDGADRLARVHGPAQCRPNGDVRGDPGAVLSRRSQLALHR